jgi:hypothetical protein
MFDRDMRLTAWNRNFQDMLDLAGSFLAERPSYADCFRRLAAQGEFGAIDIDAELRRYQENVGRHSSYERMRPDDYPWRPRKSRLRGNSARSHGTTRAAALGPRVALRTGYQA